MSMEEVYMPGLFKSLCQRFSGDEARLAIVRRHFREAMDAGAKLEIRARNSVQSNVPMIVLSITSIGEDHFVVGQATADSARLLKANAVYSMGLYLQDDHLMGETTCLGRYKYQDEQRKTIYTHRFSLPTELTRDEKPLVRSVNEILFKDQDVELNAFELRSPIHGITVDLKRHKARLRCHNASNKLQVGQNVYLKTELPEPVGKVADLVRIVKVQPMPGSPSVLVDVAFHTPIARYDDLVDRMKAGDRIRKAG
ncbi:MAG: hypothetical protein O7G85_16945 [Planctomycetota bacterium]|nr:hypothetical protein [Planctomycetota bacterium]